MGKVIELPNGKHALYRWIPKERLRTGLFSLDRRVLQYLLDNEQVAEIHFEDMNGTLYSIPKFIFEAHAEPLNCGERGRVHVAREHFLVANAWYVLDDCAYSKKDERIASKWPEGYAIEMR